MVSILSVIQNAIMEAARDSYPDDENRAVQSQETAMWLELVLRKQAYLAAKRKANTRTVNVWILKS